MFFHGARGRIWWGGLACNSPHNLEVPPITRNVNKKEVKMATLSLTWSIMQQCGVGSMQGSTEGKNYKIVWPPSMYHGSAWERVSETYDSFLYCYWHIFRPNLSKDFPPLFLNLLSPTWLNFFLYPLYFSLRIINSSTIYYKSSVKIDTWKNFIRDH